MSKTLLAQAILNAHLLNASAELTLDKRRTLAEKLAEVMDREIAICNTREQQDWLMAKAWSVSVGRTRHTHRRSAPRNPTDWDKIRAVLADMTNH